MEPGVRVWCKDPDPTGEEAWILSEVVSKTADEISLRRADDPSVSYTRPKEKAVGGGEDVPGAVTRYDGVEMANAKLSEEDEKSGADDNLITLPHLHEPALLHAVHERFNRGSIYTYTGPVLIAVNPFQRLPLYTEEILETYRRHGLLKSQGVQTNEVLNPHVYSIADISYRQMMRGDSNNRKSQSILISGESGAGKTETTKIVMLYLTTLGSSGEEKSADGKEDISTMEKVLQSNPILEAFGNGKTLRNDNSSRFGKYIELGFSRAGILLGAKCQTYLLEKVRVGTHASGERNYHIFYQVLRGASPEMMKKLHFSEAATGGLELANTYHYTSQGGAPQLREFGDDAGFDYTLKAMRSMGWAEETIDKVVCISAGILHLGEIQFDAVEQNGQEISKVQNDDILHHAAELLGVEYEMLVTAITESAIITRGETIKKQLSPEKSMDTRDSLAKTIYGALFLWVVEQVNKGIGWENDNDVRSSVGVLDIFGFECFPINSFEQLCINFTNEALQQQFNKFIFKMEQDEYENEKIDWAFVDFPDNQDCLDTIQSKPTGILAQLDDECRLGSRGSDRNWANRLYKHFIPKGEWSENTRFKATAIMKAKGIFCIRHFAGTVQYTAETGFLEKNKDEIPLTAKAMFESAPNQLMRDIFEVQVKSTQDNAPTKPAAGAAKPRGGPKKSKTVGTQFKEQLQSLMNRVETTEPHYIRCLKPNDAAKPKMFTRRRITEQLRCGGVLEAVRVARMGYPVRMDHSSFYSRYRMLLPTTPERILPWNLEGVEPQKVCIHLVELLLEEGAKAKDAKPDGEVSRAQQIRDMQRQPFPMNFPKADVQPGLNKIFMRKGPYDAMEAHRVFHQSASATLLQSAIRGMQENRRYLVLLAATEMAQRWYRGCVGRAKWWRLREAQASQLLTNTFRMLIYKRKYIRARFGTTKLQGVYRGFSLRRNLAARKIQTHVRMCRHHSAYKKLKSASIAVQCASRRRVAKNVLKSLMGEQKDIGKLKENNEKLKSEMAGLKAMLAAMAKGDAQQEESDERLKEREQEIAVLEKRVSELERQLEHEKSVVADLEKKLAKEKEKSAKQLLQLHQQSHMPVRQQPPPAQEQQYQHMNGQGQEEEQENIPQSANIIPEPVNIVSQPVISSNTMSSANVSVSAELLAEHNARVARLEQELAQERHSHKIAEKEILRLRAAINGASLGEGEAVSPLIPVANDATPTKAHHPLMLAPTIEEGEQSDESDEGVQEGAKTLEPEITGAEEEIQPIAPAAETPKASDAPILSPPKIEITSQETLESNLKEIMQKGVTPQIMSTLEKLGLKTVEDKPPERPKMTRNPSDYFPLVRRGFTLEEDPEKEEEEIMAVGWKVDVTNRREREEALRDEVKRFEIKMKRFNHNMDEGIDITVWQLNRNTEMEHQAKSKGSDEWTIRSTPVILKLVKRGDMLVQSILTFNSRGGYLSKALGRGTKAALDPLPLHEILDMKAGCIGYDMARLPGASTKSSKGRANPDNKHCSMFLTLKAAPTPMATSRNYFLRFKSRSSRNDVMVGLRGLLADLQIREGVGISSIHSPHPTSPSRRRLPGANTAHPHHTSPMDMDSDHEDDVMIPLADVHKEINKERQHYDRLLLQMLQSNDDLKEKEDELLRLRAKLDHSAKDVAEKEKAQANDSKLIMQLSKKLEMLLMDNEDLRDQNDRLNGRLVAVECEKMNLLGSMQT
mmetsp:Transcript_9012/g.13072  ORF Transcript_9012/g.13072 Transcript_9012/m.13072 type:complete len:1706 (-) Transcript_9012:256-5373(-)|eukprot:CAMPEP_0195522706 /NCGR_PEP_ID=MMETSP0794_2-20130614/21127_1 /TAXON_ID=515487 /ORGANISM="Stephanopyxis turris, Strain CCMP 815" /LENGTH=1705 /DNA_ID=CAMNT_0040652529 /DNA_START=222 /DNA_END=5339 /DNA_ORIENTATION=+